MKPVGTVHFATARSNKGIRHAVERFDGPDRIDVQLAAVAMPGWPGGCSPPMWPRRRLAYGRPETSIWSAQRVNGAARWLTRISPCPDRSSLSPSAVTSAASVA